jgi:AcrR family transcriptional regulator
MAHSIGEHEKTRRLTREQKKALTRSRLLEAAQKVFLLRGFHRAGLEEVAEEAGFTRGAVYSNFESKDELFLALLDERIEQRIREFHEAAAKRGTLEDMMRWDARRWTASMGREREWTLLLMEFWTHAARDPRLRGEFAARHLRLLEAGAQVQQDAAAETGETLLIPALELSRAASAMGHGVALKRLVDPDGVPEELLETMFEMFFREATLPAGGAAGRRARDVGATRAERGRETNTNSRGEETEKR